MPAARALENLVQTWRLALSGVRRRASFFLILAVLFGGAHVARLGTPLARGLTALALVLALSATLVGWWIERRRFRDTRRILRTPSAEIEAKLGYVDEPELIHRDNLVLL